MKFNPYGHYGREHAIDKRKKEDSRIAATKLAAEKYKQAIEVPQDIEGIVDKLEKEPSVERLSIHDPYFTSQFSPESIKKDEENVQRLELKYRHLNDMAQRKLHRASEGLELLTVFSINNNRWFGRTIRAQRTAAHDDLNSKVDFYFQDITKNIENRDTVGVAADLTTASFTEITGKLNDLKAMYLDRGAMPSIKYFKPLAESRESAIDTPTSLQEFVTMPRLLVGVSRGHLFKALRNYEKNDPAITDPWIGLAFLSQMEIQLKAFAEYSQIKYEKKKEDKFKSRASEYTNALHFVQQTLDARLKDFTDVDRAKIRSIMAKDETSKNILNAVEALLVQA